MPNFVGFMCSAGAKLISHGLLCMDPDRCLSAQESSQFLGAPRKIVVALWACIVGVNLV